jgi:hypothetical protein
MKRFIAFPLLLILLVGLTPAHAECRGKKNWNWWKVGKITQDLGVSADQQTQLDEIAAKFDPILTNAGENLDKNITAYKEAKSNKATSSADVIKTFDTMWDSMYKTKRVKLDRSLEMRDVLTQEQITKLSEIKQAKKDRMMRRQDRMKEKYHQTKQKNMKNQEQ